MASFGEDLRRERELRGISLQEIAEATKIGVRFLQALEQDRLDVLPGGLFPRSFLRQYAAYVGLDADRLVAEFVYAHGVQLPEAAAPDRNPAERRRPPYSAIAFVAAGVVFLLLSRGRGPERTEGPMLALPAAPLSQDRVYPPPSVGARPVAADVQGGTHASDTIVLTLSARQSCWVEVQVDGQSVLNRVLSEGETQTLEAQGEIVLSVGNAGGLSFSVNDRPGVPLGRSGEVRKNIVISRESLPSLVRETVPVRASHSG